MRGVQRLPRRGGETGNFCGYCARRSARAPEYHPRRDGWAMVGDAGALRELRRPRTARTAGRRVAGAGGKIRRARLTRDVADDQADACGFGRAGRSVAAADDRAAERLRARGRDYSRGTAADYRAREIVAAGADAASGVNPGYRKMAADKFIDANGLRLHYLDYGNDGAPWVVCVHGLTGNAHNFDALAPHLAAKYHVISVDVRGRGDSNWGPPTEYLNQNYVTDLAKMLEGLGVARASLIGTSMGGIISMMYAGGWPERVERLVINDIGPEIDPVGAARIASYVGEAPERFKDIGEVVKYYKENYPPMAKLADSVL